MNIIFRVLYLLTWNHAYVLHIRRSSFRVAIPTMPRLSTAFLARLMPTSIIPKISSCPRTEVGQGTTGPTAILKANECTKK